ncbi:MAG: NAD-binding protein, partial [bacterium]
LFLGLMTLCMRFVLPHIFHFAAQSSELLIVLAIGWAVALAAAGDFLGFSKEIGAFLAGVSLASTPYRESLSSRLVSVRDFLLLFFFIDLGAYLKLAMIRSQILPALGFSLFVLIGNPFIVMVIMGVMGFRKHTGFFAGLTVAQISEFSLMLGALGRRLGHIPPEVMGLITLVGIITIGLSTYMILYSHQIYERLGPWLGIFERHVPRREIAIEELSPVNTKADVLIVGMGRFGENIARELSERGLRVLGVDFDPELVRRLRKAKKTIIYGDAEDPDLPSSIPLSHIRWVVSSLPQITLNLSLLHALKNYAYEGRTAFTAHNDRDAESLKKAGVDVVLLPFTEAAKEAAQVMLRDVSGPENERAIINKHMMSGGNDVS